MTPGTPSHAALHERFMRLFLENEPQILRAVMLLVPQRNDARDIVQDTAVALWQHFEQYDPQRPFLNWALGYARIHVRRFFRAVERRGKLSEKAAEALLIAADDRDGGKERHRAALRACLDQLPPPSRGLISDYYFEEKTVEVLGGIYGKTTEAVYKSIQRLRRTLLDCINRRLSET
jgi:RNA polymerase sigma-70 factor (ECF subfamily)